MIKKEIFLAAIFIFVGLVSWFLLYGIFYGGQKHLETIIVSAAIFIIFGSFYSLFSFLTKSKKIILPSFALVSFSPFIFFGYSHYLFAGLVIFFVCLLFGFWVLSTERDFFSLKLRPMLILRKGLNVFFLALSLIISLVFYLSPSSVFKLEIPKPLFEKILNEFSPFISMQFPGFNPEMTVGEFQIAQILFYETQPQLAMKTNGSILEIFRNSAFAEISKIAKNSNPKYLNYIIAQDKFLFEENKKNFSRIFGGQITGEEKLKDVVYGFINNNLLALSKPYQNYISFGFVLVVFLALQTLTLPFNLMAGFFSWIIFKAFIILGIVKIRKEMVEKEIVSM